MKPKTLAAYIVWHDRPGRFYHFEDGSSIWITERNSLIWLDEKLELHARELREGEKLPKFKILTPKRGTRIIPGDLAGTYTVIRSAQK